MLRVFSQKSLNMCRLMYRNSLKAKQAGVEGIDHSATRDGRRNATPGQG